jgi:hypothetical protein
MRCSSTLPLKPLPPRFSEQLFSVSNACSPSKPKPTRLPRAAPPLVMLALHPNPSQAHPPSPQNVVFLPSRQTNLLATGSAPLLHFSFSFATTVQLPLPFHGTASPSLHGYSFPSPLIRYSFSSPSWVQLPSSFCCTASPPLPRYSFPSPLARPSPSSVQNPSPSAVQLPLPFLGTASSPLLWQSFPSSPPQQPVLEMGQPPSPSLHKKGAS